MEYSQESGGHPSKKDVLKYDRGRQGCCTFRGKYIWDTIHSVDVPRFSFFKTCLTRPMFDVNVIVLKTTPLIRSITVLSVVNQITQEVMG